MHAAGQQRPDIARRRYWWKKYQPRLDIGHLVFIDETWAKTNMAPIRGWCRKGERLAARVPHGHWKTLTFLAGLRSTGITAPCVFDGPINGESFRLYVEQILIPSLRPGDIVVMDNLGSHKGAAIRAMLRRAGARLHFLPAYSPDLNPIEQVFAKLKHLLRKAKERSVDATSRRIGSLLETFSADECRNYFLNAGYGSMQSHSALVTDNYNRRCAITQERTLPALEAAPIWPYGDGGDTRRATGCSFGVISTACSMRDM